MCSRILTELNVVYVILVIEINFVFHHKLETEIVIRFYFSHSLIFFYKPTRMKDI